MTLSTPHKGLLSSMDKLFKEGTYSDLTITCGDDEYKVHKSIVCPGSSFFVKACSGPFKEGTTGIIALPDDNPHLVKLMVHFLYYLDYPQQLGNQDKALEAPIDAGSTPKPNNVFSPPSAGRWAYISGAKRKLPEPESESDSEPKFKRPSADVSNLTIHARLYALGEKYEIKGLKSLSLSKFKRKAMVHWNSADFIRAVEEVYTGTVDQDRGMRDAAVVAIRKRPAVLDKKPVQDVVKRLDLL